MSAMGDRGDQRQSVIAGLSNGRTDINAFAKTLVTETVVRTNL